MNKREKSLFTMIIVMIVIFGAFWGVKKYMTYLKEKQQLVSVLEAKASSYGNSASIAEQIEDEVKWLAKYQPAPSTYGKTQSDLVKFLNDSGRSAGFEPIKPRLITLENNEGIYRRVKVEITGIASEEEIYKWLVSIHQPTKFRAVTQIIMKPTAKDEKISCTLTAEQWLIDSDSVTKEEVEG